jgi:hypothetical protein
MLVGEIEKNALQKIRVSSETYNGHDFLDIIVYYYDRNELGNDYKFIKKEIAIAHDNIEELIVLLRKAQDKKSAPCSNIGYYKGR